MLVPWGEPTHVRPEALSSAGHWMLCDKVLPNPSAVLYG